MGYDITNNTSIVELGIQQNVEPQGIMSIIDLPSSVPSVVTLTQEDQNITSTGTITVEAIGGVPPYTYSIDGVNYQVSNVFTNIRKNNITVYIKDSVGTIITIDEIDSSPLIQYIEGVTSIPIPTVLPASILVGTDNVEQSNPIVIPNILPPDGTVLLEIPIIPVNDGNQNPSVAIDKYYKHSQGIASYIWDIYHNLAKRPAVHIEDMSGNEMIGQIIHFDNNHAQVVFGYMTTGTAHCN